MNVFVATGSTLRVDKYYENSLLDLAIAAVSELEEELSEHRPDVLLLANAYGESTEEQVQLAGKLAGSWVTGFQPSAWRTGTQAEDRQSSQLTPW